MLEWHATTIPGTIGARGLEGGRNCLYSIVYTAKEWHASRMFDEGREYGPIASIGEAGSLQDCLAACEEFASALARPVVEVEFSGRVVNEDGAPIYERVSGTIVGRTIGGGLRDVGQREWDGTLRIDSGEPPAIFAGAIVMESGREGRIQARMYEGGSNAIEFFGRGEPPFDWP